MSLTCMLVMPLVAFVLALVFMDKRSSYFYWNIVCFGNSMALCYMVQRNTLKQ